MRSKKYQQLRIRRELVCFNFHISGHGNDEVDGGTAGDDGGDCHHQTRVVLVTHGYRDLVNEQEIKTNSPERVLLPQCWPR